MKQGNHEGMTSCFTSLLLSWIWQAVISFFTMQFQMSSLFFTFSLGTRTHYFGRTILHGGTKVCCPNAVITCVLICTSLLCVKSFKFLEDHDICADFFVIDHKSIFAEAQFDQYLRFSGHKSYRICTIDSGQNQHDDFGSSSLIISGLRSFILFCARDGNTWISCSINRLEEVSSWNMSLLLRTIGHMHVAIL